MSERREPAELEALFAGTLAKDGAGRRSAGREPRPPRPSGPGKTRVALLASVVAVAALVPLYGDPRTTPLTHPLWARLLLRALELDEAVRQSRTASQVFATLSWRDSLSLPADRYLRAQGVARLGDGRLGVTDGVGEVAYAVSVTRGGDYRMRLRLGGSPQAPATAEIAAWGAPRALQSFTLVPAEAFGWVPGGATHLDPGSYTATVLLPAGVSLEQIELAPPCLNPIEPPGGWQPQAVTTVQDVAVTALKALDREDELPLAAEPLEKTGAEFQVQAGEAESGAVPGSLEERWLKAGSQGVEALVLLEVPSAGLYTLYAFGVTGEGQRWLVDECRKAIVCPGGDGTAAWRPVLSQQLQAGRHFLTVRLAPGASLERIRLERKQAEGVDYVAALRRLGFDPGPDGPVARERALAAMDFIRERRADDAAAACGELRPPEVLTAGLPPALGAAAPTGPGPSGPVVQPPTGPGNPPVSPPLLPPQQPASPIQPRG